MRIRTLEPSDAELFYSFRLRGLMENPEAFGSTFAEESVMPAEVRRSRFHCTDENFVLGAFGEEVQLIGVAGFYRETHLKLRHKGFVWGMYVAPESRGAGVGRALLSSLIEHGKSLPGLEQIGLDVVTVNEAARNLYLSQNFQIYALEREAMKQDGGYYDVEHMVLRLG
ncbi:MAG: GNAT family N-acetyltransferase [Acidobacteria bacterium]|nr:GNAT family N-acetyltransferase [Acidobacteriota bacterium]